MAGALFVLATAYRIVYTILGGYITARLAPHAPVRHALILGLVGLVTGLLGVIANIAKPELGPLWYSIAVRAHRSALCLAGRRAVWQQTILRRTYMQKIVPFLWFDGQAEEAMNFYVSIFKNSKVLSVTRYGAAGRDQKGRSCPRPSSSKDNSSTR